MPLNKTQIQALKVLRKRLSLKDDGCTCATFNSAFLSDKECCERTRKTLEDGMSLYLQSWVLPLIDRLIEDDTKMLKYLTQGERT